VEIIMDEESKKIISVKTPIDLIEDINRKVENSKINGGPTPSLLEIATLMMHEYSTTQAAKEASKSPEQQAREAEQLRLKAHTNAQEKAKKEHTKLNNLFKDWLKRDTWLVLDEAMLLIKAEKPEDDTIFNLKDERLWTLVQSCAGYSLQLLNLEGKPKQWRVKPFEWVRWLKEKEQYVHPQLVELLYPKTDIKPTLRTARAIQSREIHKRERQKAIKAFAIEAEKRARKNNIDWSNEAIPVTKVDFLRVLGYVNPVYKKITKGTFDNDIAEIGLKFKRGTKSNKNNVLKVLFSIY
jgi:hypothetical protein